MDNASGYPPVDKLQCPACAWPLRFVSDEPRFECNGCSRSFPFEGRVPLFDRYAIDGAPGDSFDYAAHYRTDHEAFDYFEELDAATGHEERRLHQTILKNLPRTSDAVLDVGCGRAWVAGHLAPTGAEVWSLDISPINPARALERYPDGRHYGIAADAFHLPFKDRVFDAVVASEIIEHVVDPARFVSELMRVVRPGGVLVVTTPYKERIKQVLCIHCNQLTPLYAHLHSFDERRLSSLYARPDLETVTCTTFNNKALTLLRAHVVLKHLPYPLWKITDGIANTMIRKPHRLMAVFYKR